MKLVDILARELKEWPEGISDLEQSADGSIYCNDYHVNIFRSEIRYARSDDWVYARVTRDEWSAAKASLRKSPSLYIQQFGRLFRALSSDPDDIARAHISNLIYGAMSKLGQAPTADQVAAAASVLTAAGYRKFEIIDEPKS